MQNLFFETFHKASSDYPYLDCEMKNINYLPHFHEELELAVVRSGEVCVASESGRLEAKKDDICIFMPGEIHSYISSGDNSLYIMKLNCKNSQEKIDFSLLRILPNVIQPHVPLNSLLRKELEAAAKEINAKKTGYAYMSNSIANKMLCDILRSGMIEQVNAAYRKKHVFSLSLLADVNEYIEQHYMEKIYLSDAAAHCNLSQYYFSHLFKEITQKTFYDFLTAFRLEKSLGLLLYSDKKITAIAYECGFSNVRSFNRAFKKAFDQTPSDYIKVHTGH